MLLLRETKADLSLEREVSPTASYALIRSIMLSKLITIFSVCRKSAIRNSPCILMMPAAMC
ncbi:hypothetical protein HanPSC8_Chr03g0116011 [Helianthus annuus]|nr:hypothetical protein HanPSC8_Chr03g0116011 [Helianthus annuus]